MLKIKHILQEKRAECTKNAPSNIEV